MRKLEESFVFLALAYNHQNYIIEHLESIKYLVENYGSSVNCKLIINDDCSKDKTTELIDFWLSRNSNLFCNVVKIYNGENLGTCASLVNMLSHVDTQYLKVTACDDVYSFENIFKFMMLEDDVSILSGYPLSLVNEKLFLNKKDIFNILASDVMYCNRLLADRFKFFSNNNAPNIIYNHNFLTDDRVIKFLGSYDVIDDWPIQIGISKYFPHSRFKQLDKVFVYYRRTSGSAYLVASDRFYEDKVKIYRYLIDNESVFIKRTILKSRHFCFKLKNSYFNKIFNLGFYVYFLMLFYKIFKIFEKFRSINFNFNDHALHYNLIKKRARIFLSTSLNENDS
jgi:hypothetical protein